MIVRLSFALLVAAGMAASAAHADDDANFLGLDLEGSLGDGMHSRYVPPVTNFLFNETPYITTEVKPLYAYHRLPSGFVTGGGHANVVALQGRLAITERLGLIATKDGYSWFSFKGGLPIPRAGTTSRRA